MAQRVTFLSQHKWVYCCANERRLIQRGKTRWTKINLSCELFMKFVCWLKLTLHQKSSLKWSIKTFCGFCEDNWFHDYLKWKVFQPESCEGVSYELSQRKFPRNLEIDFSCSQAKQKVFSSERLYLTALTEASISFRILANLLWRRVCFYWIN